MASKIDISGLTKNPVEVGEMGQFIVEKTFGNPVLNAIHAVWTGIQMKEQIVFASQFGKTGIKDTTCTRPNSGAVSTLTQKYWDPSNVGDTLIHCQADVDGLFKAYYNKIRQYVDKFNIEGTELEQFLSVLLTESAMNAVWRLVWLGDKSVAAAGAGTSGLKLAANVKFYDAIDGLWQQIFTDVTATTISAYYQIAKNLEVTTAAQMALSDTEAIDIFEALWDKADSRLRAEPNAQFLVTRKIFENYRKYLQGKGENFSIEYTMEGLPSLKWNGKAVVNMETVWDLHLQADFVDNTTNNAYYLPNRVLLTVPANIPIGTLNESDMSELDIFYEKKERQLYAGYGFTLDAKYLEPYMVAVAY